MANTTKSTETKEVKVANTPKEEDFDIKEMMKQMQALMKENKEIKVQMEQLQNKKAPAETVQNHQATIDREVSFVSLYPGLLNLSTEGNGQGQVYTFEEFGQIHKIPYSEAKLILKNQSHVAKDGYFYVYDAELIKSSQLTTAYKIILDQNGFENLFTGSQETFKKIFNGIPKAQQESFADLIALKLYNKEYIDMNIVAEVGNITKRDLVSESRGDREIFESK